MCLLLLASVGVYFLLAWLLILGAGLFGVRLSWSLAVIAALLLVTSCLVPWLIHESRRAVRMEEVSE